ncbi:DeoR family transcriptional regulator [Nitratifractor sp.]|uniref:HTH domain-containing protein n=1 Tax=Nitratifractor sp. TaxID=2268144 RepID=UPI0025CFA2EB|nr:DeoR family transcriptional regulator [Nitratifractor sp.]
MKHQRCIDRIDRLLALSSKLTRMESLSFRQIAEAHNVSERTARRDIDKLKEFFPLENQDGTWRIDLRAPPIIGRTHNISSFCPGKASLRRHSRSYVKKR